VQCALLCLLALHAAGLLDVHSTAAEQNACVACQVADNHTLGLPDPAASSVPFLLVLLFAIVLGHRDAIAGRLYFLLPPSQAPPARP
jgi:hypothetical protein